jgi:hypothetical protein
MELRRQATEYVSMYVAYGIMDADPQYSDKPSAGERRYRGDIVLGK